MDPILHNSPFLKACRGEPTPYTPVWLMRQAGRYMPEYQAVKAKADSFLDFCKTPELTTQATLDAQRILGVDAAILFADLPPILETLGLDLDYPVGVGPRIGNPIRTPADIDALRCDDPGTAMPFVGETIRLVRRGLPSDVPLIGFSGAPFTLSSYAIEGQGSRNYIYVKQLMYDEPGAWDTLMSLLTRQVIAYLQYQIDAGVQALQLFDSWVGSLSPQDYRSKALPYTRQVIDALKGQVPIIHFGTGAAGFMEAMHEAGADVLGFDWRTPMRQTWDRLGCTGAQGNMDPIALCAGRETVVQKAQEVLDDIDGKAGHIFNLGHGIVPQTPVDNVKALVDYVHERSSR
jgi:uroporphyrinogen decarboxylase